MLSSCHTSWYWRLLGYRCSWLSWPWDNILAQVQSTYGKPRPSLLVCSSPIFRIDICIYRIRGSGRRRGMRGGESRQYVVNSLSSSFMLLLFVILFLFFNHTDLWLHLYFQVLVVGWWWLVLSCASITTCWLAGPVTISLQRGRQLSHGLIVIMSTTQYVSYYQCYINVM